MRLLILIATLCITVGGTPSFGQPPRPAMPAPAPGSPASVPPQGWGQTAPQQIPSPVWGQAPQTTPLPPAQPVTRQISFNGVMLTGPSLAPLEQIERWHGVTLPDGQYWYDSLSGLWGVWGQGSQGQIAAGLILGGPLPPNASGGGQGALTGVFINGRELHPTEVAHLQRITQVYPGRYWLDAQGNGGLEGQPMSFNLVTLAQQAQRQSQGGAWGSSTSDPQGNNYVGGDGQGFTYFMGSDGTTWYSE
ncbi:hypothetical protein JXA47_13290 [Candidatus Sumerlaeota bacterium]|nr:hypothetical protein [Candidatus Sumerlaeota bacterium]